MKEQNDNEKKKKEKKGASGEKKFYLFTAIGCAAVLIAIIVVAIAVTSSDKVSEQANNSSHSSTIPDKDPDEPTVVLPQGMALPIESVNMQNGHGFFHNTTLNNYYEHKGVDFMADAGTEVFAVQDGVVESIYKDDILLGTEIVIAHEDGVKSVYRFVTETEELKVGDEVKRGDIIATVAAATGNEYKDGAHLHFEITENGVSVDPTEYLTLEEK